MGAVKRGEQFFQIYGKFTRPERPGHPHRFREGVIFSGSAFDGVDDPAEGYAPSVVLLALAEHGAKAVLGGQDFAAE